MWTKIPYLIVFWLKNTGRIFSWKFVLTKKEKKPNLKIKKSNKFGKKETLCFFLDTYMGYLKVARVC